MKSRPEVAGRTHQRHFGESVTLGGQRTSDGRARGVFGDRMHGSSCAVNQGDLSGERLVFIAPRVGTKSQPGRSQSIHMSGEAG
ncbi:MAG: hypothetical protein AB9866_18550 [Syntrophobacteraceae bacterium]